MAQHTLRPTFLAEGSMDYGIAAFFVAFGFLFVFLLPLIGGAMIIAGLIAVIAKESIKSYALLFTGLILFAIGAFILF